MATLDNGFVDSGSSPPSGEQLKRRTHQTSATQAAAVVATQIDFRTLAVEHIARGFVVSATKPESKEGFHGWNRYNLLLDEAGVERFLAKNPQCANSNVAVCGSCGFHYAPDGMTMEGNLLVIYIDIAGVIEQILADNPRKKLPKTYIVASRPTTNPAKQHFYFRHTHYSIAAFKKLGRGVAKEISAIRDLTKPVDERGLHPNRYDLKGSGKGGFVVGAGGLHDNGERYTALNDCPVLDVSNWVVDWFVQDVLKYRAAVGEAKRVALAHVEKVQALSPRKRAALQRENNPDGFIISKENTYAFLRAKARFLATKGGLYPDLIKAYLQRAAADYCHDGKAFVESETGQHAIEHIIEFVVVDVNQSWLEYDYDALSVEPTTVDSSNGKYLVTTPNANSRTAVLLQVGQDFPEVITNDDIYKAFRLDPTQKADRQLVSRVMKKLGYKVDGNVGMGNKRYWRLV
jgi:hypothetical protein